MDPLAHGSSAATDARSVSTATVAVGGPAAADVRTQCERARDLLEAGDAEVVVCDVRSLTEPDAGMVETLARLHLTARRLGSGIVLQGLTPRLRELVAFMGLADVLASLDRLDVRSPILVGDGAGAATMTETTAVRGVLFDLLMGVMDSLAVWSAAARDRDRGLAWRDAVTARMGQATTYVSYEDLVEAAAAETGLGSDAMAALLREWPQMEPWPDAEAISGLALPYGFVTNCSIALSRVAARRSRAAPRFVLSAEEAGRYKPHPDVYLGACEALGTAPATTMFVAGSPYDAEGAHAAGLQARWVRRRPDQRRPDPAIPIASSLDEVMALLGRPD